MGELTAALKVPNLCFNFMLIDFHILNCKLYTAFYMFLRSKLVKHNPLKNARFADAFVACQDYL